MMHTCLYTFILAKVSVMVHRMDHRLCTASKSKTRLNILDGGQIKPTRNVSHVVVSFTSDDGPIYEELKGQRTIELLGRTHPQN
jgi:hypothetical protein